jgi:S1/P1 Nuclease
MPMKHCRIIVAFLTASMLLFTISSFGWGRTGHHIIAEIAQSIMNEHAKENVQNYLGSTSFEEASTWMDEMRSEGKYDYMKPWHYINIEKGGTYIPGNGDNIIDRLNITYKELQNKQQVNNETITTDLLIIFHLVGDLFQPLHVGYGSDRGGNSYQINLNGKGTNLHAVWDNDIIEDENITKDDCMELYKKLSPSEITKIRNTDFVGWMNENRKLLDGIYPAGHKIDDSYLQKNKIVVEKQLLYAGIKLAAVLESLFTAPDNRVVTTPTNVIKITAEDAEKYIGKKVIVCSMVYSVKELPNINFINLGARFPDNPLTIVVFPDDKRNFKQGLGVYDGKNICITGVIKEYKGNPEIIITDPQDISIQ